MQYVLCIFFFSLDLNVGSSDLANCKLLFRVKDATNYGALAKSPVLGQVTRFHLVLVPMYTVCTGNGQLWWACFSGQIGSFNSITLDLGVCSMKLQVKSTDFRFSWASPILINPILLTNGSSWKRPSEGMFVVSRLFFTISVFVFYSVSEFSCVVVLP